MRGKEEYLLYFLQAIWFYETHQIPPHVDRKQAVQGAAASKTF